MSTASRKKRPHVTMVTLDFAGLQRRSDRGVYREFDSIRLGSPKRIFPPYVWYNSWRVSRQPDRITIHLAADGEDVAYYSFIPGPRYS